MRCYVDYPSRAEFQKAFRTVGDLMFVRSREDLEKPDLTLGAAAEDHHDLLLVGPENSWFARIECSTSGRLRVFGDNTPKRRKTKRARAR